MSVSPKPEIQEPEASKQKKPKRLCPESLTDEEKDRLLVWAQTNSWSKSQCAWAWNVVKDWSHSKQETRADWSATVRNALRDGWGLKGYKLREDEKYGLSNNSDGDQPHA